MFIVRYSILSFACLLCCISFAASQDFIARHYDLQDGLASPTIHSIFQDKDGFLWFGTESGLCRYDGNRFKTFTVKDGLPGNEVFGMLQDHQGRIWLQLYKNSIAYIRNGKIYTQQNDSLLKKIQLKTRVYGIAEDREGNVGLCDYETLFVIQATTQTVKSIHLAGQKAFYSIGLYTDNTGQLTLCDDQTVLYKVENDQLKQVMHLNKRQEAIGPLGPTEILLHPQYIVASSPYRKLTIYLRDTMLCTNIPADYTLKYSPISDSVFSINTNDGSFLFNTRNYRLTKLLPGKKVTNTFIDREKNLWLGTSGNGIYKISSQEIVNKKIKDNSNDIYYISKTGNHIVAGNNNKELYLYDKNKFTKLRTSGSKSLTIYKIFYYEKQNTHVGILAHAMGLVRYIDNRPKNSIYVLMLKQVDPVDEEHLLVAAQTGLVILRKNNFNDADTVWNRPSLCALKTNDSIFAGTSSGLFILKKSKGRYSIVDSLLQPSIIAFIKKTDNNLVWVCTYENGLYCLRDGKIIRHFSDTSGLMSNNGRSLFARHNTIWMGTDKGFVKITPAASDFHLQKYSTSNGLPSNIINSIYVDNDTVYIGTPEGLCYFNESMIEATAICNLVLTSVRIGDSLVDFKDKYIFPGAQRFIIEFAGISFRSEQEMTYRYKIEGIDNNWQHTNLNTLEFTSLPYGDYVLKIIATNKFGKESLPLEVKLLVTKPFYKTTFFIVVIIALPIFVLLLFYNYRENLAKKKQLKKLQQEIKIMELEQMALRAQMNPHFIFNCLSTIQQLVTENDTGNTHKFISSFAGLVRQTLDNAQELFISLSDELKYLSNYFELERIKLEDRFSYVIDTTGIKNPEEWYVPNMVIQPFVENAIRHGVRYKSNGKGFISVVFEQRHDLFRCTITDNGIGRENAERLRQQSGAEYTSRGMGITFKRIESLNALSNEKTVIKIEDLKNDQLAATGTRVIIDFCKTNERHDTNSDNRR